MSVVATSRPSIAPIMQDRMRTPVDMVGNVVSALDSQFCCLLPYAHPIHLIVTL